MKPNRMICRVGLVLGLAAVLALWACGVEDYQLVILGSPFLEDDCKLRAGGGDVSYKLAGTWDVGMRDSYSLTLEVQNRLFNRELSSSNSGAEAGLTVNMRDISLIEARFTIEPAQGSEFTTTIPEYRVDLSGMVIQAREMEGVQIQKKSTLWFYAVPSAIAETLVTDGTIASLYDSADVVLRMVLVGKTLAGGEVESNEYAFPITLCVGCLNNFEGGMWQNCPKDSVLTQDKADATGKKELCFYGQDGIQQKSFVYCLCPTEKPKWDQQTNACVVEASL